MSNSGSAGGGAGGGPAGGGGAGGGGAGGGGAGGGGAGGGGAGGGGAGGGGAGGGGAGGGGGGDSGAANLWTCWSPPPVTEAATASDVSVVDRRKVIEGGTTMAYLPAPRRKMRLSASASEDVFSTSAAPGFFPDSPAMPTPHT